MTAAMDARRAEAQRLRDEGLTYREIADRLGYNHAESVRRLLHPDMARELARRDNAKRSGAKRAWEREHDRGTCPCGAVMCVGAARKGYVLCRDCHDEVVAVGQAMRDERIAELWAQGRTLREIASELDSTPSSIGVALCRMRTNGWDLPYRHNRSPEGLERAQNARRAA